MKTGCISEVSGAPSSVLEVRQVLCRRGPARVSVERASFVRGGFHLLVGEPESGHELLLRVLGLLDLPETGEVFVEGEGVRGLSDEARLKLRERRLGFVFAAPFLLPAFSVIENVAMPLFKISEVEPPEARRRSEALLEFAGLTDFAQIPCEQLAPLAQQRVSLARALVNEPAALLIESLDSALAGDDLRVFSALLREAAARFGIAVIASTSPRFLPEPGDHVFEIVEGVLSCDAALLPHPES